MQIMKQAILDTNFIISCIKQKIDFFEELKLLGIKILIPKQVINELKNNNAELALNLLGKEKNSFELIDIGKGHVDKRIIEYAEKNPKVLIATLDREIKTRIQNNKILIKEKKRLEIV